MKKIFAFILGLSIMTAAFCGCSNGSVTADDNTESVINGQTEIPKGENTGDSAKLPNTYEIAATDPHYIISTPDWKAEGYGNGFALNENGNKKYAIVVACDSDAVDDSLEEAFLALYNDNFQGVLMQNYRAKYSEFTPETTQITLNDGSSALLFNGVQPADDYGTEMNCPVYGYGFIYDGVPFIVAYIVIDETAANEAKQNEMKGYVDEMVNTVRIAQ